MAYFTETDETITLKHNQKIICTLKKPTQEEIKNACGATFTWSDEPVVLNENTNTKDYTKRQLTISTPDNLADLLLTIQANGLK
jgi:hypothetical protein